MCVCERERERERVNKHSLSGYLWSVGKETGQSDIRDGHLQDGVCKRHYLRESWVAGFASRYTSTVGGCACIVGLLTQQRMNRAHPPAVTYHLSLHIHSVCRHGLQRPYLHPGKRVQSPHCTAGIAGEKHKGGGHAKPKVEPPKPKLTGASDPEMRAKVCFPEVLHAYVAWITGVSRVFLGWECGSCAECGYMWLCHLP